MIDKHALDVMSISSKVLINLPELEAIVSTQEDASLRSPSVEAHYYRFFYQLCRVMRPRNILELGTHTGISSMCFALGAPDARIVTVNILSELREECRCPNVEYLRQDSLEDVAMDKIDILFIDTEHNGVRCLDEFNRFAIRVVPGGLIFIDDIHLLPCMEEFWKNFNPLGYQKFELPIHGTAGMGVLIKEAQEA